MNLPLFHILTVSIFLVIATGNCAYAAGTHEGQTEMYLRAVWGLAIVVGIMLVIFALVRKRFSLINNSNDSKIKVLEMRPLMPKKSLCLVEVEGKKILLGISADNINLLANIDKSDARSFSDHLSTASKE